MLLFSFVTYYTSTLLAACYRFGDPDTGKRNYTYIDAVRSNFGGVWANVCLAFQYKNLGGSAIAYTILASLSMMAIKRSICFHASGGKSQCKISSTPYMIFFGVAEIIFSQIPYFGQIWWWLSIVATFMSFTYSSIGIALGIKKVAENGKLGGSLTGISIGTVTPTQKIWRSFQALGDIAFAYSYSLILIEIQDTVRSPPSESKTLKKATAISVGVTTVFFILSGCFGYAAFGDLTPENLLTGFGFHNPYWLLIIANVAIVVHFVIAYQVYCQPLFDFGERIVKARFPESEFITRELKIPIPGCNKSCRINLFRLIWRTIFVIITTVMAMLTPSFIDLVGILGAFEFWPLTVYFPVEMYIAQKNIPKWSGRWLGFQILSGACLFVTITAAIGSVAGIVHDHKSFNPFKST